MRETSQLNGRVVQDVFDYLNVIPLMNIVATNAGIKGSEVSLHTTLTLPTPTNPHQPSPTLTLTHTPASEVNFRSPLVAGVKRHGNLRPAELGYADIAELATRFAAILEA